MAKARSRKSRSRRTTKKAEALAQPVQRTIPVWASVNSATMIRVDAPNLLSRMNSRLYRQGRNYRCQFSIIAPNTRQAIEYKIFTLPNTWFTHGAIKHAWKQYRAAMQDELMQSGGQTGKWHDFRMGLTDPDGTDANGVGVIFDGNTWKVAPVAGDAEAAIVTNSAGTEMAFNVVGSVSNSYNILYEYAQLLNSRQTPATDFAGPQSYEGLFKGADDLDHLMEKGDQPPYSPTHIGWWDSDEDGTLNDASTTLAYQDTIVSATSGEGTSPQKSRVFDAPLGLVYITTSSSDFLYTDGEGGPELALTVSPGNYKGVHSDPIFRYSMSGATAKSIR